MLNLAYRSLVVIFLTINVASAVATEEVPFKMSKKEIVEKSGYSEMWIGTQKFIKPNYYKNMHIIITTLANTLTINSITVNRGNCDIYTLKDFPVNLKFGEVLDVKVYEDCNPIEVKTDTNQGRYTNTWEQ